MPIVDTLSPLFSKKYFFKNYIDIGNNMTCHLRRRTAGVLSVTEITNKSVIARNNS